jgi:ABC-type transport system involved in multi-copper enzyme maturation permease subunit
MYAVSFVIGIDISAQNFENDPEYQAIVSRLSLLNPGFVYQMAVGLFTHRTISIDFEGVPGWLLLLSLVLWPLTCLRIATWLFKREMRG